MRTRVLIAIAALTVALGLAACSPTDVMRCYTADGRSFVTDRATATAQGFIYKCVQIG